MFLALREIKNAKGRFIMIGLILVLISWFVFILSGLGMGCLFKRCIFKNMDADYVVFEEGSRNSTLRSVLSEKMADEIEKQPNVEAAAPMGTHTAVLLINGADSDDEKIDSSILGVNPGTFLEPEVIEGQPLTEGNDREVLANETLK